ncbi:MAG: cation:proton antiporter [Pirellulales bacterium]
MEHQDVSSAIAILAIALLFAKAAGAIAQKVGQPAVLGELCAGVILGKSILGLLNPESDFIHLLAELGVIILLFEIGMETDLRKLLSVGAASSLTAIVGVILPFSLGYVVCWGLGLSTLVGIVVGASLTATSVGITARVLSDLNQLDSKESRVIIGAAVLDDVIGLVILSLVTNLTEGKSLTALSITWTTVAAFGFLAGSLVLGRLVVPKIVNYVCQLDLPGTPTMIAVIIALGLSWLAAYCGSAMIIGAFAAGLLLRTSPQADEIEVGVAHLGHFFVPMFFLAVGASVDVRAMDPLAPDGSSTIILAAALIVVAIFGKLLAGYAATWFSGRKLVVGVGMIPRGEVGLIFAKMGLATNVFDNRIFGAVLMMVLATTFIAPVWLRFLLPKIVVSKADESPIAISDLVNDP